MPAYIGVYTVIAVSSTPNQSTPPMGAGIHSRICATNEKPVCCVEMARSLTYFFPSTSHVSGRQR